MNLSTFDALTDFEQCLSDALKNAQHARLEFEARLATALAEERIEPGINGRRPTSLRKRWPRSPASSPMRRPRSPASPKGRGEGMADDEHGGGRAAMIGGQLQHQRPMRAPHLLGARARLKPQDLVGLLLRHRAKLRAAARPRIVVALSVFTPAGKPAVEIRL